MRLCEAPRRDLRSALLAASFATVLLLAYGCGGGGGGSGAGATPAPPPVADVTLSAPEGATQLAEWALDSSVQLTVSLSQPVNTDVAVTIESSGSAVLGGDFELSERQVRVPSGSVSATLDITPIRDFEEEGDETISLEIGAISGDGRPGANAAPVSLALLDQGGLFEGAKDNLYAKLYVFFYDPIISEGSLEFETRTFNLGVTTTSATQLDFWVGPRPDLRTYIIREQKNIPPLMPGYSTRHVFTAPLRQFPGPRNYYAIAQAGTVLEEAPGTRSPRDFSGFSTNAANRVQVACPDLDRDVSPGMEDPLKAEQWNLENKGQAAFASSGGVEGEDLRMVRTLADGPTGEGVKVAVVDTGLEVCHPDLENNVEPGASYNFNHEVWPGASATDPFQPGLYGDHGTSVAGIIAAEANNGIGGRGVAPSASIRGYNYLSEVAGNGFFDALGASANQPDSTDVDIFNMSFGNFGGDFSPLQDDVELFRHGVGNLRSGRGAIYVKSSGNGFGRCNFMRREGRALAGEEDSDGDGIPEQIYVDVNINEEIGCVPTTSHSTHNLPYLIMVGAFSANGERSSYSEAGSALWASAPAGEYGSNFPAQISTDQMGAGRGYDTFLAALAPRGIPLGEANPHGDYISTFNGTSAAAPNASGAIALLLEAQPELTWRDVKHILARTARQIHPDIPEVKVGFGGAATVLRHAWVTNAAGYNYHNWYGFGAISVDDALDLARSHTPDSLGAFSDGEFSFERSVPAAIPDHSGAGANQSINVTGIADALKVEAVQLRINVSHPFTNDLGIYLTSPSGTESILNPPFNEVLTADENLDDWALLSNAFYGETPLGEWTLKVVDAAEGDIGTLDSWSLVFYLGEIPPRQ